MVKTAINGKDIKYMVKTANNSRFFRRAKLLAVRHLLDKQSVCTEGNSGQKRYV